MTCEPNESRSWKQRLLALIKAEKKVGKTRCCKNFVSLEKSSFCFFLRNCDKVTGTSFKWIINLNLLHKRLMTDFCLDICRKCRISWTAWRSWSFACSPTTLASIWWAWRTCCRSTASSRPTSTCSARESSRLENFIIDLPLMIDWKFLIGRQGYILCKILW